MSDSVDRRDRSGTLTTLGLPLVSKKKSWAAALLLLIFYGLTMARDLSLFDSSELALVAVQLGLGHPTGQPLHTLLGFLFSHIPGLPPLIGLNFLSALAGALCVIPVISIAERSINTKSPCPSYWIAVILAIGLHPALWEPATRVEVYSLAAVFGLWAIARIAGYRSRVDFFWAGLALGIGACANPYVNLMAAFALSSYVISALIKKRLTPRVIPLACAGGLLGLIPYLYVPLIASRRGVMVWGAPTNAARLRHYFLGLDYASSRSISCSEWLMHIRDWLIWATERGLVPLLVAGIIGYFIVPQDPAARFPKRISASIAIAYCILAIALVSSNSVWQPDVPDYLGYLTIALWLAAAGVVALLSFIYTRVRSAIAWCLTVAVIGWCLSQQPVLWKRSRHLDRVARTLAYSALSEAPPRAILIAESDHWVSPMLYLQQVEHVRQDVIILAFGLTSSSWFWEQAFNSHPDLSPIHLKGEGGRVERVKRLLSANSQRPISVEKLYLADRLQLNACVTGWFRTIANSCPRPNPRIAQILRGQASIVGEGAPSALGALCLVALERGLDLWRQGMIEAAETSLLSSVPTALLPRLKPLPRHTSSRYLVPSSIRWQRPIPLGEPGRNLYIASLLRLQLGDIQGANALVIAAAQTGLPEAQRFLDRR
ncbi:MAG: DUF2723 domain-containing protein [Deltaproteobacteria bacterium]|nr:DUF2723 domain-containing protein [Deltaproteobacteria bacterium]